MSLLEKTVGDIEGQDAEWRNKAKERLDQLTMPHWALGQLMDLSLDLAGMVRSLQVSLQRRTVVVMAGDHGVAAEGVSQYPQEVTPQMVANFVYDGAGINALARAGDAKLVIVDMGVAADMALEAVLDFKVRAGTDNIAIGPAMSAAEARQCVETGIKIAVQVSEKTDIFGTGDMGIANTTPSAAIAACLTGMAPVEVTGRGTGIDEARWP